MLDRFFRRLTVRSRITGGFLILILLVIVSIPLTIANYNFLLNRLQQVSDVEARADRLLLLASTRIASSRVNLIRYIQDYAPSPYEALDDVEQATQHLLEAQNLITSPKQKEAVTLVLDALEEYKSLINDMEAARQLGENQDASRLQFQTIRFGNDIGQRIEQIVKQSNARVTAANQAVYANTKQRLIAFIIGYIGMSALAMILGILIARSITRPIAELQKGAEAFRQGYMETVIPVSGSGELSLLARTFNQLAAELSELYRSLEQRVDDRSHALELSAEVSRRLSTILDQEQLMTEVVEQVRLAFNYYYAQIYLFDKTGEYLVLAHGTGKAGRTMLERKHSLPKGRGLVGRAAETNTQVLAPNVYRSIGVEIITQDNVADIYQRETDPEFEAQWYADWIAERFGEIEEAKQLARQKPATDKVIQIGYILHLLTEFTEVMKRGAEAAARDLQVDLEITAPSKAYEHLPLFEALISKGKDGLVAVPYGEQWSAAFQKAIKAGIPVVAANIASPLTGITNVLQSNFQSGSILARELTKFLVAEGKQHGKIILGPGIPDRIQGFMHGMRNTNYTIIQIDESVGLSGVHSPVYWREAIEEHPDLIAAVGLMSFEIPVLAELKRDSGAKWLIGGYDLELPTIEAIESGIVQVTISQHPYLQGYLPILALVEHLRRGKPLEGWMAEGWLPNLLLPKTKAEMAVPIATGEEVLGVLDVQDNIAGSLTPEAVNLLQSIADQVAIGLQNARLVADFETALAETRAAHERYLEQSWKKAGIVTHRGQYHYTRPNAPALDESTLVEARQQALSESQPTTVTLNGSEASEETQSQPAKKSIVAPITLRDKAIGALHLHPASDDQEWAEDDLVIVEAVVDQLAQTAESLRLFEETRQRAGREQVIREITNKLRTAPNLEQLLKIATTELSQRLSAAHAELELGLEGESTPGRR